MRSLDIDADRSPRQRRPFCDSPYSSLSLAREARRRPLELFVELCRDGGDVVRFQVGRRTVLMVNAAEHVKHILQDNCANYHKSQFYEPLRPILGDGIFTAEGDAWLRQRRTGVQAMQGMQLRKMGREMTDAIGDMLTRWSHLSRSGAAFDIAPEMMRLTLDILLRSLFSIRLEDQHDSIREALTVALQHAERRIWSVLPPPSWLPTPGNMAQRRAIAVLDAFVDHIIEDRRACPGRGGDFLATLLRSDFGIADESRQRKLLRDEILSMILAGHETTANALCWTWHLLSRHPQVERELREEVADVLEGRVPTIEDVAKLPRLRMAFQESMRLYPPVWTISRVACADDVLGTVPVPRGTTVMLCTYAVHHREDYWPNPEGFDPTRFTSGAEAARPRFAYFPFSAGPRNCLGRHFAMIEAALAIAMVMQRFRLDLVPGHPVVPEPMITLRPRHGLRMRIREAHIDECRVSKRPDRADVGSADRIVMTG